jgi:asparagine synthetase B (glutamine-hydrolysing)
MFPSRTVMDLVSSYTSLQPLSPTLFISRQSLALALYFAARGHGSIRKTPDSPPEKYISPARVLLNGLGSDELLGGYGRHRTAFKHGDWKAVIDEVCRILLGHA